MIPCAHAHAFHPHSNINSCARQLPVHYTENLTIAFCGPPPFHYTENLTTAFCEPPPFHYTENLTTAFCGPPPFPQCKVEAVASVLFFSCTETFSPTLQFLGEGGGQAKAVVKFSVWLAAPM